MIRSIRPIRSIQGNTTSTTDIRGSTLLAHARSAIAHRLGVPSVPMPQASFLADPGATFVTLKVEGELRGCVGSLQPRRPLGEDVRANAQAAAFDDPRFPPLDRAEYDALEVEVSVLSASAPIVVASERELHAQLRPGIDGVTLQWGGRRATFLPQVWESLPDPRDFLGHLKRKAGLPLDFWSTNSRSRATQSRSSPKLSSPKDKRHDAHDYAPRVGNAIRTNITRRAGGTGSTTAASSATCARVTAGCTTASAVCALCASAKARRWSSRPMAAPRDSASIRSRRSRSTTSIRARPCFPSAPPAATWPASSARTGTSPSPPKWTG